MNQSLDTRAKQSVTVLTDFQRDVKYLPFSSDSHDAHTELRRHPKNTPFLSGYNSPKQEMAYYAL